MVVGGMSVFVGCGEYVSKHDIRFVWMNGFPSAQE